MGTIRIIRKSISTIRRYVLMSRKFRNLSYMATGFESRPSLLAMRLAPPMMISSRNFTLLIM